MAIYQFNLVIIPKEGFIKKFGTLSSDFKLVGERDEINLQIEKWWQLEEIDNTVLVSEIEEIIGGNRWANTHHFSWKNLTNGKDNDACLEINTNSNYVQHISFRADLREGKGKSQFLLDMIEFVYQKRWLFMDKQGNVVEPKIEKVDRLIELSNTYWFLQDPVTFLTGIVDGTINPE